MASTSTSARHSHVSSSTATPINSSISSESSSFPSESSESPTTSTMAAKVARTWNYDDGSECGPCNWPMAQTGLSQSPIDLKLSKMKVYSLADPIKFVNYNRPLNGEYVNTGYSVQFIPDTCIDAPEIYGGMLDQSYRFIQYHYHWAQNENEGSEHTLGGLSYPAELHLVHQGVEDPSKLAVLGVFLQILKDDSALSADETVLESIVNSGDRTSLKGQRLSLKLPENTNSFCRYHGSLTTPPCSENVLWTVFTDPISVTREQLAALRSVKDCSGHIHRKNYRPTQPLNNRQVLLCC
uniref:Carbonic anhydrase n=1 Tax=Panagrellus redivivus TaxID=6233 RepID=A0A7E4VMJ6_PANRE